MFSSFFVTYVKYFFIQLCKLLNSGVFCGLSSHYLDLLDPVPQSVTCLTADPGVASSAPAPSHTFAEIDLEIISTAILFHSADSRMVVAIYK